MLIFHDSLVVYKSRESEKSRYSSYDKVSVICLYFSYLIFPDRYKVMSIFIVST